MIEKTVFRNKPGQFDLLKGILILLVVIDHLYIEWLPQVVAVAELKMAFAMGCFFFIYGYTLKKTAAVKCLKQQASLLLKPYLIMMFVSVLIFAAKSVLKHEAFTEKVVPCFLTYLLAPAGRDTSVMPFEPVGLGTQWFFLCSFWAALILNGILHLKEEKYQALAAAASGILGLCLGRLPMSWLQIPGAFSAVPFLYAGYCWNKNKMFGFRFPKWSYITAAGVSLVYLCFFSSVAFCSNFWGHGLIDYLGTLLVSVTVIVLYMRLPVFEGKAADLLRTTGRYSYWLICINGVDFSTVAFSNILNRIFAKLAPGADLTVPGIVLQHIWSFSVLIAGCRLIKWIQQKLMERRMAGNER